MIRFSQSDSSGILAFDTICHRGTAQAKASNETGDRTMLRATEYVAKFFKVT